MKIFLKRIVPPVLFDLYRSKIARYGLFGNYSTWKDAQKASSGYDDVKILKKVKESLLKVKNNEVAYERDSVLFDKKQYSWPLLAGLLEACVGSHGELRVLDFGGSLGTTYFQNRLFLKHIDNLQWAIVEQNNFVKSGQEFFADSVLKFYYDLDLCTKEVNPNVAVLSSVIQYIEEPFVLLEQIIKLGVDYIIIDRTPVIKKKSRIVVQRANPAIYEASYPSWLLNENNLVHLFDNSYDLLADFSANDGAWHYLGLEINHKGYILKKKV